MAMTNAERQRRYREKALHPDDPNLETMTRLQIIISPHPAANLKRMVKATGMTQRELIEKAINELAEQLHCNYDKD